MPDMEEPLVTYSRAIEASPDIPLDNNDARELRMVLYSPLVLRAMKVLVDRKELASNALMNQDFSTEAGRMKATAIQAQVREFTAIIETLLALATPSQEETENAA